MSQDFIYDDFIPHFNATKFNASAWVDLFANAGARYFVLVTVRFFLAPFQQYFKLNIVRNIMTDSRFLTRVVPRTEVVCILVQAETLSKS